MKITSDAIKVALKTLGTLVTTKSVRMIYQNKKLSFVGVENGTVVFSNVPCVAETGDKSFAVEVATQGLSKSTTGRKELSIKLTNDDSLLSIRAKGYEADLAVISGDDGGVEFPEPDKNSEKIDLDAASWDWLQKSMSSLTIDPVPGLTPMLYCKSTDKGAFACTFDHIQMMFSRSKAVGKKDFSFYLPYDRMSKVFKGLPYDGTRLYVNNGGLLLLAKTFKAFLPLSADSSDIELGQVDARVKEIIKTKGEAVELDKEHLDRLVENVASLDAPNLSIVFTPSKDRKSVVASCVSPNGKMKVQLAGQVASEFALSQSCLSTVIRISNKDTVSLSLGPDNAYVVAKSKTIYYVAGTEAQ